MIKKKVIFVACVWLCILAGYASAIAQGQSTQSGKKGKWVTLFDGKSLEGWHLYNQKGKPITNWQIEDEALVCLGTPPGQPNGALVTDAVYDNFILEWEWRIDIGSNSGVFYHVVENPRYKRGPQETGPEYQIIDDENFPGKLEDWQKTGADYAMYPAHEENKKTKKIGQWNKSRIIYNYGKVSHYLNGKKIVEFDVNTEGWKARRNSGKWKDFPDYANVKIGAIALQDHHSKAYFRKIRIKEL